MALDALFEQLQHPNPNMQSRARVALAQSDDPMVIPRLMTMLSEVDVPLRRSAVKALGTVGEASVGPLSERLATTADPTVGSSCCKALAQVADQWPGTAFPDGTLDLLCAKALENNPVVQITAVMALGEMGSRALPRLQRVLAEGDVAVKVAGINALAGIGGEAAQATLQALAEDATADPYVQESATAALTRSAMGKREG